MRNWGYKKHENNEEYRFGFKANVDLMCIFVINMEF